MGGVILVRAVRVLALWICRSDMPFGYGRSDMGSSRIGGLGLAF